MALGPEDAPKQISHLNDSWKQYTLGAPEFYKYKSFDGLEIEAALLKPMGYDGNRSCRSSRLSTAALREPGRTRSNCSGGRSRDLSQYSGSSGNRARNFIRSPARLRRAAVDKRDERQLRFAVVAHRFQQCRFDFQTVEGFVFVEFGAPSVYCFQESFK